MESYAVLNVVQEFLVSALVGGRIVLDDLLGVLDVYGQYLEFGNHLADEKRERTHNAGDDELHHYNGYKLNRKRKHIHFNLENNT